MPNRPQTTLLQKCLGAIRKVVGTSQLNYRFDILEMQMVALHGKVETVMQQQRELVALREICHGITVMQELYQHDLMQVLNLQSPFISEKQYAVETEHPVAFTSMDHLYPLGTAFDNTRSPRFVRACETILPERRPLRYLDMGCAGGGLVFDFLLRGHRAFGLEGSDYSQLAQRAEWRILRDHLATCDIAQPFTITDLHDDARAKFDVITAWDVMEHIPEALLPNLLRNVVAHLAANGIFLGSIATFPEVREGVEGIERHVTVHDISWWQDFFVRHGLQMTQNHGFSPLDYCRGIGAWPYKCDYLHDPESGFHFVVKLI